ncbi:hypothetical protein A1OE_1379 [Candidatus Endolissoclinum faulkneri L2]|uniref:Uncharacterized protein n=1 Tax=Candidatus Endolissoclinum faulkneri L2 TaxID=1193729 RepID=K7YSN3_9PROT|nr:hypothetical protein A1OE_1379 [Candidatus Endolissoclinum faulkneri L2]
MRIASYSFSLIINLSDIMSVDGLQIIPKSLGRYFMDLVV